MLRRHIQKNIALKIPYPKLKKQSLSSSHLTNEYNRLIYHFSERADSSMGLRNLIIIMLHITTNQGFVETITC